MTLDSCPSWASELIEMLEQQRVIYEQLGRLSEKQGELVQQGDAESLLAVLSQRQAHIDYLLKINEKLEPIRQRWPDLWAELDTTTRNDIRALMDDVQRMLDVIIEQDEADRRSLADQRKQVTDGLQRVSSGAVVNRAYGNAGAVSFNRFTDQQG
jgi:hypothetical protein